jgi:hypothetical protein
MNLGDCIVGLNNITLEEWSPWTGSNKCPQCSSNNIEVNNRVCLTSNPPQSQLRCKDCGHKFSSGITYVRNTDKTTLDKMLWQHDQSILGKPQVGDWPPSPQIGDPGWQPAEVEPPSYPDIFIPGKGSTFGWICPKCNRCLAPHVPECWYCNSSNNEITG